MTRCEQSKSFSQSSGPPRRQGRETGRSPCLLPSEHDFARSSDESDDESVGKNSWLIVPASPDASTHSYTFPSFDDSQELRIYGEEDGQKQLMGTVRTAGGHVMCSKCHHICDENETYSRHESQKFSDGQSFSKTASMPHSSSEKISALSEPDSTRLTELDPNHEVVAGSKRTSSNPVKSTISEGPTQLYYTDMEAVNDFVRRRWESFTSKPRSEILGHLMTIILPNQRKYHPYTKHKESTSASPPWWPTQKVKWGSPCRMMDSDKYELLTFLFMAPYRAPEFVEDFLRNPPSPGSDLFPNWKAVLKKAFSKCHMRKDGSNRDNGKTKARQSKGSDDSSVKIEQRKRSVQFLLEVAEDVENIMTNKTDATGARPIQPLPDDVRKVAYGQSQNARNRNNKRTAACSGTSTIAKHTPRKIPKTLTDEMTYEPTQTSQVGATSRHPNFQTGWPVTGPLTSTYPPEQVLGWHQAGGQDTRIYAEPHREGQTGAFSRQTYNMQPHYQSQRRLSAANGSHYLNHDFRVARTEVEHVNAEPISCSDEVVADVNQTQANGLDVNPLDLPLGTNSGISSQTTSFTFTSDAAPSRAETSFPCRSPTPDLTGGEVAPGNFVPDLLYSAEPTMVPDFGTSMKNTANFANIPDAYMNNVDLGQWASAPGASSDLSFSLPDTAHKQLLPHPNDRPGSPHGQAKWPSDQRFGLILDTEDNFEGPWLTEAQESLNRKYCKCHRCIAAGYCTTA